MSMWGKKKKKRKKNSQEELLIKDWIEEINSKSNLVSVEQEYFHQPHAIHLRDTKIDEYRNSAIHFLHYITAYGSYKMDQSL